MLGGGGNQTKTLPKKSRYKAPPPPQKLRWKKTKSRKDRACTVPPAWPQPGPTLPPPQPSPLAPQQGGQQAGMQLVARGHSCHRAQLHHLPGGQRARPTFDTLFPGYLFLFRGHSCVAVVRFSIAPQRPSPHPTVVPLPGTAGHHSETCHVHGGHRFWLLMAHMLLAQSWQPWGIQAISSC